MAAQKAAMTDGEMDKVSVDTGAQLKEQQQVKIKLHLPAEEKRRLDAAAAAGLNPDWPVEHVIVNGYNYYIKLGIEVEVPQTVKEILEGAGLI